ncbi:hypothetical protein C8A05DRAFT_39108, partial [Staphylotrichum tortipilum]
MWLGKCFAAAKGYAFATLRNGTECWYGNNWPPTPMANIYNLNSCLDVPCTGDSLISYGGSGRKFLLYQRAPAGSATFVTTTQTAFSTYLNPACYFHTQGTPALKNMVKSTAGMTVEQYAGLTAAQNATFAGVEDGRQCWYGNLPSEEGLTREPTLNNCFWTKYSEQS